MDEEHNEYHEQLARLRAELDQAREGLKELAAALWALYTALTQAGFTRRQALDLTHTWLAEMVAGGNNESA